MAHFAKLNESNIVEQVIVVHNNEVQNLPFPESEPLGIAFCKFLYGEDTIWKQTSYNATFRKNYAGIGYTYDETLDAFLRIPDFPSWILNQETCQWEAPIPYPTDGQRYYWDETTQTWVVKNEN